MIANDPALNSVQPEKKRQKNPLSFLLKKHHFFGGYTSIPAKKGVIVTKGIFGAPLEYAAQCGSITSNGLCVPDPVNRCFTEILQRGLRTEGIFRLSGAASEVNQLQRDFDRPPTYGKYLDLTHHDIHAITGVVKKFLRNLPESVIPSAYHDRFLQASDDAMSDEETVQLISGIIKDLPVTHFHLLYYILSLASSIQQYAHINMMSPEALAVVLAPVCTGLEQTLKDIPYSLKKNPRQRLGEMSHLIERNAKWTHLWTVMIEHHHILLQTLDQHRETGIWKEPLYHRLQQRNTMPCLSPAQPLSCPTPPPVPSNYHPLLDRFNAVQDETLEIAPHQDPISPQLYWYRNQSTVSLVDGSCISNSVSFSSKQQERYEVVVMRHHSNTGYKRGGRQRCRRFIGIVKDDLDNFLETQTPATPTSSPSPASSNVSRRSIRRPASASSLPGSRSIVSLTSY
ncbi:Rho GTPase activation protein [Radiomyces spectabilis]|uniref:Rho GTPase activation protein n=1 Tax=Radiomyces spectabilis TaxID=64574 RepID=UPI002220BED6|nr:Rho GTPase activation protein [Radiomyces spectabilis]KAI8372772.1 Rho GTPase activation protein [Radiomyces spectabilis]